MRPLLKRFRNACLAPMFWMLGPRRIDRLLVYLIFRAKGESPIEFAHRFMGVGGCTGFTDDGESWFIETVLPKWMGGKDCPVLLDVGANTGHYSQMLRRAFPNARIHAFEPNPECWPELDEAANSFLFSAHHFGLSA